MAATDALKTQTKAALFGAVARLQYLGVHGKFSLHADAGGLYVVARVFSDVEFARHDERTALAEAFHACRVAGIAVRIEGAEVRIG